MARRPIKIMAELADADVPRGNQGYWRLIREACLARGEVTVREIDQACNTHRATIAGYVARLVKAGILVHVRVDHNRANVWALAEGADPGPIAPPVRRDGTRYKRGLGREQMWRTIGIHKQFRARDLAIWASTAEVRVSEAAADEYCRLLAGAGVLITNTKLRPHVYRLREAAMTGPLAPSVIQLRAIYDRNTGQVLGRPVAREVDGGHG
ncbi:hypothetical protein P7L78_26600 [Tistrella bauzanensis]|uniref:hypothetical protein n=1 Tax=Tistrella TaxID=171436 RepID=UPI0031F71EE8